MERKPYKNSVENKSRIIFSLAEIMANKPFHAVSVTEVCKKAGVSKNTFYRHFESLSDVIYQSIGEINREMVENYSKTTHKSTDDFILFTCAVWYKNRAVYRGFTQDEVIYIIHRTIKKNVEEYLSLHSIEKKGDKLFGEFFATVFCMFLCWWSKEDFSETPEEIAAQIKFYLCENVLLRTEPVF